MSHKITIEFENKEQAEQFFGWLSITGEQNFWEYQETQNQDFLAIDYWASESGEFAKHIKIYRPNFKTRIK